MTKKKVSELPSEIYVYREQDGDEFFFLAYKTLEEAVENAPDKQLIGTYILDHQAKYTVDKTINEV